ncbi:unnamed protein product [Rotaria sp. Silwood1]|nr:unnamed protein product [Rotaria sp. Silwood1]CAF1064591.1 unnamed protein product [Rotaria sp. Silwood1]
MFLDEKSIKYRNINDHINLFSSKLKGNVIKQAASRLLQHVTLNKNFYHITQNINGNAFDDYHTSSNYIQRNRKEFRRTDKCNSWLSKFPTKSDTSLNRLPIFIKSPLYKHKSRDYLSSIHIYPQTKYSNISMNQSHYMPLQFHQNSTILSNTAIPNDNNDINPQYEPLSQPLIMVHKKRLRRDYFLSTMQNCIQPPYSPNHFYAFDQINMLKLQRNLHTNNYEKDNYHRNNDSNLKRKYVEIYNDDKSQCNYSDIRFDQISLSKKHISSPIEQSSPKTADHMSINKYHDEIKNSLISNEKSEKDLTKENQILEQSNIIISHLEKILNLCGELRSLAKDVENHHNEKTILSNIINNKNPIDISESEQITTIDIQQTIDNIHEKNISSSYQLTNDTLSIHSESNKSHPLMQTESFKTKSPSLTNSRTTLRKSEDICSCFLKSIFDKQICELNIDEQEYLNELTKAYLLGKKTILKEQQEENNKFQTLKNEILSEKQQESNDLSSLAFDTTNNNNQSNTPASPSSILFYDNFQKLDNHLLSKPNNSKISLIENDQQQQLSIPSGMISLKHELFINEPIAMKTTNVLPGIGTKYAQQLSECGFTTVRRLLGFYLMIKDDQHFVIWLNNKAEISIHSAWLCTNALRAWCEVHL